MAQRVVDTGGGTEAFVQDLTTKTDTAFPFDNTRDEEHTCINGDGSFLGFDKNRAAMNAKKDTFLFDRSQSPPAAVALGTGVNDAAEDEVYCVLDSSADHLGFMNDFTTFQATGRRQPGCAAVPDDPPALPATSRGDEVPLHAVRAGGRADPLQAARAEGWRAAPPTP